MLAMLLEAERNNSMEGYPERRLIRRKEARFYLGGMSETALWRLQNDGTLRPLRVGSAVYYDIGDLDAYINSLREVVTTYPAPVKVVPAND